MSNTQLSKKAPKAFTFIRNTIIHKGYSPSIREVMRALDFDSPNSAAYVIKQLVAAGYLRKKPDGSLQLGNLPSESRQHVRTINVPIVGSAPCGKPFLAQENIEGYVSVSTKLARPPHRYFFLRAVGDSMNKKQINNDDLVLVRQQQDAENGETVVALIDDEATIKELHKASRTVTLQPRSTNPKHRPIIVTSDFQLQGKVIAAISGVKTK